MRMNKKMNNLQIFNSEEFGAVRTVTIENEPWFVGKDVAVSLGYKDTSDALKKHVADEDKLTRCFADSGQNRQMYIINESGLYALIFGSKLESAKRFKRWVTSEVLPAIRKTGSYQKPLTPQEMLRIQLVILVEHGPDVKNLEDVWFWQNPRKHEVRWRMVNGKREKYVVSAKAVDGKQLYKSMCTIRDRYNVRFEFCEKKDTGKEIVRILSEYGDAK